MKKKIVVLVVVILLLALTIQVAFAHHDDKPNPPYNPDHLGSCNMNWWAEWDDGTQSWVPLPGPGNDDTALRLLGERGMYNVHFGTNPSTDDGSHPQGYTKGATHMDNVTTSHCVPPVP